MSDRLDQLLDETEPVAWKPSEPGEKLIGEYVRTTSWESGDNDYGAHPVVVVRTDDGQLRAWHVFHTAALSQLAAARPEPGQRIGIKFLGPQQSKAGRDYVGWKVIVDRPDDWDAMAFSVPPDDEAPTPTEEPF